MNKNHYRFSELFATKNSTRTLQLFVKAFSSSEYKNHPYVLRHFLFFLFFFYVHNSMFLNLSGSFIMDKYINISAFLQVVFTVVLNLKPILITWSFRGRHYIKPAKKKQKTKKKRFPLTKSRRHHSCYYVLS